MGDAAVRRRLVRLSVLPAGLVALTGAVVVCLLLSGRDAADPLTGSEWAALVTGALVMCGLLGAAGTLAAAEARGTAARCAALRRSLERGQAELRSMLWALRHGEHPVTRTRAPEGEPVGDALDLLGHQAAHAQCAAEAAVVEAVGLTARARGGSEERAEVVVSLARRLQSLVHREIELIDELENEVEDPDLLKGVFHVDHLATRTRRHVENLAVLGGATAQRRWSRPVPLSEVLRSAVAEVEQYTRVQLVPPVEGAVRGHAVADVIHLLAELAENATMFSAPETRVLLRTQRVTAGLAVEVEDRGRGMDLGVQNRLNAMLAEPGRTNVPELLRNGRIGLYVVAALARRHGVVVQLRNNIYGGVQAVAVLPQSLLGGPRQDAAPDADSAAPPAEPASAPDAEPADSTEPAPDHGRAVPSAGATPDAPAPDGAGEGAQDGREPAAGPGGPPVPGAEQDPVPGAEQSPAPGVEQNHLPEVEQNHAPGVEQSRVPGVEQAPGSHAPGPGAGPDPRPRARARGKGRVPVAPLPFGPPAAPVPRPAHAPVNGQVNGGQVNGAPANGTPANGAPANGTPANGRPANGAPANGTPATNGEAAAARPPLPTRGHTDRVVHEPGLDDGLTEPHPAPALKGAVRKR
ncbi:ATP-binding protein [Streptomyces sp. 891-h]|uniref:sensor histidine kinase n=1 Tax=Streptomyces sp. 891-h TaxID=2720714 RepID=UPI001FA9C060|nr:ATP-binding protein [Streptomyces sp. 891-h]UNZ16516.1 ATP-binding protein [Streptomyces sp. 891-h]